MLWKLLSIFNNWKGVSRKKNLITGNEMILIEINIKKCKSKFKIQVNTS